MVGRTLQADYYLRTPAEAGSGSESCSRPTGSRAAKAYRDVSFKLHAGEILGIAGVIGSGREELTRTLAGFAPHDGRQSRSRAVARCRWRRPPTRSISASATSRANGGSKGSFCSCPFRPISHWPISPALRAYGLIDARKEQPSRDGLGRPAEDSHAEHPDALPQPLRRQPAEGRSGEMAEREGEDSRSRSPDPRPRRRRQGGGL